MENPVLRSIEQRASANRFDPHHRLPDDTLTELIGLATRAPTAYNLQNWRFIAVRSDEAKARLLALAYGQRKVADAAVTFIVCGVLPDAETLPARLRPAIEAGLFDAAMAESWRDAATTQFADHVAARDEAVRSGILAAATLMQAAGGMGLASGPMIGFDAGGVAREFGLAPDELPVLLLTVGHAAPGNWPQKPRRPVADVLEFA